MICSVILKYLWSAAGRFCSLRNREREGMHPPSLHARSTKMPDAEIIKGLSKLVLLLKQSFRADIIKQLVSWKFVDIRWYTMSIGNHSEPDYSFVARSLMIAYTKQWIKNDNNNVTTTKFKSCALYSTILPVYCLNCLKCYYL